MATTSYDFSQLRVNNAQPSDCNYKRIICNGTDFIHKNITYSHTIQIEPRIQVQFRQIQENCGFYDFNVDFKSVSAKISSNGDGSSSINNSLITHNDLKFCETSNISSGKFSPETFVDVDDSTSPLQMIQRPNINKYYYIFYDKDTTNINNTDAGFRVAANISLPDGTKTTSTYFVPSGSYAYKYINIPEGGIDLTYTFPTITLTRTYVQREY